MQQKIFDLFTDEDELLYDLDNEPIWLHYNKQKYWQIQKKELKTIITVGKLLDNFVEVPDESMKVEKTHNNLESLYSHITKLVQLKLYKGYELKRKNVKDEEDDQKEKQNKKQKIKDHQKQDLKKVEQQQQKSSKKVKHEQQQSDIKINIIQSQQENEVADTKKVNQDDNITDKSVQLLDLKDKEKVRKYYLTSDYFNDLQDQVISSKVQNLVDLTDKSFMSNGSQKSDQKKQSQGKKKQKNEEKEEDKNSDVDDDDNNKKDKKEEKGSQNNTDFRKILGQPCKQPQNVLLAEKWNEKVDPTGYYMSEKLDGVRCFWTGTEMYSRNQNKFFPPEFFTKNWPKIPLDGELWIKRNSFQRCISIIKNQKNAVEDDWKEIKFMVYDAPASTEIFVKRYKALQELFKTIDNEYLKLLPQVKCESLEQFKLEMKKVLEKEGEGLMLRVPDSLYERKRSNTLLKVKVFLDEEATIIGKDQGVYGPGVVGALIVQNHRGTFRVGSGFTLQERRSRKFGIGKKITYKYQNLTDAGIPRFPIFLRLYQEENL